MTPRRRNRSDGASSSPALWSTSPLRLLLGSGAAMLLCVWVFSSFSFLQDINVHSNTRGSQVLNPPIPISRQQAAIEADDTAAEPTHPPIDLNNQLPPREELPAENVAPEPRELVVTPSAEQWPMQESFYTSTFASADETSTTIIFNLFKGPAEALRMQLDAATKQQGVTPPEIWVMCFNSPMRSEYEAVVDEFKSKAANNEIANKIVFTVSDFNHKFHGRFLLAYMATTKYVLIVDDDKNIDETTVVDYITHMNMQPGVWGNFGHRRASTFDGYKSWPTVGFDLSETNFAEMDYLSGMWFVEQSWLEYFVKERMPSWETSEDMHLSHVMRKYLNLNTYGGKVALAPPGLPKKKYAATVGKALDLREYIFDHQLGRGNKVANVDQPIDTIVYAETVEDIENFIAKIEACKAAGVEDGKPLLRQVDEPETEPDAKSTAPWCAAGKTAAVFRGGKEQDVLGLITAAQHLCDVTQCEYMSLKPKIKHPIKYFNMREGFGQASVAIPWQTSAADVLTSFVGILNNIQPQRIFVPDVSDVQWVEPETETKMNRLQIYHDTIRLAIYIHRSTPTNQKWDDRATQTYPTNVQAYVLRHTVASGADETLDRDEESWEQSIRSLF